MPNALLSFRVSIRRKNRKRKKSSILTLDTLPVLKKVHVWLGEYEWSMEGQIRHSWWLHA